MEGVPKQKEVNRFDAEKGIEVVDYAESLEKAKEIYIELLAFKGTDVVGQAACDQVEMLSHSLSAELLNIPPDVRMAEGLPWHPLDAVAGSNVSDSRNSNDRLYSMTA